jgi:N-acyl-D-aspartate/D-glutamate deacylase
VHDLVIRGGKVVDGLGNPARTADVAIDNGHVVAVGDAGPARRTIHADGRVVAPGFIDVHTHLDVQGFWDPALTPSCFHGVTTVLGGNCGFTVAPLDDDAAGYLMRMLAKVEGMPLESLEQGVPWDWRTTAEYFDRLDGRLALNAGFMVGHSAIRRVVMGEEATARTARVDELDRMGALLRDGLAAGGLGFSSTWASTHIDAEGRPVPSRHADAAELVALAAVCGDYEGTSLEFLPAIGQFPDEAVEVMVAMSVAARRPLNWNIIVANARSLPHWQEKLAVGDLARARGGKVIGLVIPESPAARFSFRSGFVLDSIPGWDAPLALPHDKRLAFLRDPSGRRVLAEQAAVAPSHLGAMTDWGRKVIVETFTPETKRYEGRIVADIAAEEGKDPFDALLDIVCADGLRTSFCNLAIPDTDEDWAARASIWRDPRAVVGASDAGAHLDMLTTFSFSTTLLQEGVRQHSLLTLEEAVRLLTDVPAHLYGLRDRGRLTEGAWADIVIFDEATVGRGPVYTSEDLPAGAARLCSDALGIGHVLVNGEEIVANGELTGAIPGILLRSGRDTATPALT